MMKLKKLMRRGHLLEGAGRQLSNLGACTKCNDHNLVGCMDVCLQWTVALYTGQYCGPPCGEIVRSSGVPQAGIGRCQYGM